MTELERVAELQIQQKEYFKKWHDLKVVVTQKLFAILNDLNTGPAPLLPLREDEVVGIDEKDWQDESIVWKIRKEIYFVNQDPTRDRIYDFGSSFSLYITNNHITINHGSCGEWGLDDKGQWSRLILMKAIFDHQQDIIDTLDPLICFDDKHVFDKASQEIDKINRALEEAKRKEEEGNILTQLKKSKYLVRRCKHWTYPKKENGECDYDKGYYEYYWINIEKINKITEVSVITNECDNKGNPYDWINRRHKLNEIIRDLKYKYIYAIEDLSIAPPQDEGSK